MKVLIIEDETPASEKLMRHLKKIDSTFDVASVIVSVASAIKWLEQNPIPDLIIADIQLADGTSFEIFNATQITCPVIFTTAFNQYAIDAFKFNSIDYLLKPVKQEELERAITKFKIWFGEHQQPLPDYSKILEALQAEKRSYQKRMVIRFGDTIKTVEVDDVAYFYTENKINYLCSKTVQNYPVDFNLDELEQLLDPKIFFRINRQFIVNIHAIQKMTVVSKSRVKLTLLPVTTLDTIVSTERSSVFKQWLAGN